MNNFDPELINRLKNKIPENDWQMLQTFLNEEKQLDSLRKNLLGQLEHNQNQIDQEWQNINERQRTKLISDIQSILYDLQLVEHASKKPFLGIAKIIFSANPARCIQRETSPAKSKPPKRRKNELCGLMSSSSDEITSNAKRPTTAREAKIFGANQVQQQEEDRIELDDPAGPSSNNFNGQPSRRGGRTKRKTRGSNKNSLHLFSHSPIGEKDEEVEGEEEDQAALNLLLKSPSPPTIECAAPIEVSRPEEHSQTAAETSPKGTKTRKRGRGENSAESVAGIAGGRSPRKRGNERQRNRSGSNGHGDDDCEDEKRTGNADEPTYCFCKQVSFGNMIGCDNKTCPLEWFHFACVGLTSSPKGKWYCPHCRENNKDVKK